MQHADGKNFFVFFLLFSEKSFNRFHVINGLHNLQVELLKTKLQKGRWNFNITHHYHLINLWIWQFVFWCVIDDFNITIPQVILVIVWYCVAVLHGALVRWFYIALAFGEVSWILSLSLNLSWKSPAGDNKKPPISFRFNGRTQSGRTTKRNGFPFIFKGFNRFYRF